MERKKLMFPIGVTVPTKEETIKRYQKGIDSVSKVLHSFELWLDAAFPQAHLYSSNLIINLSELLTQNNREYIEQLEKQPDIASNWYPPTTVQSPEEQLIKLTEERDRVTSLLQMSDNFTELPEPMNKFLPLLFEQYIQPQKERLEWINQQISALQAKMESEQQ
jgi:hypothetical protein